MQYAKFYNRELLFILDVLLSIIAFIFSIYILNNFRIPFQISTIFFKVFPIVILFRTIGFLLFEPHKRILRFNPSKDIELNLIAVGFGSFLLIIGNLVHLSYMDSYIISMPIIITDFFVTFGLLILFHLMVKSFLNQLSIYPAHTNLTIIYGASELGLSIKRILEKTGASTWHVTGFVDEQNIGKTLENVPVINSEMAQKMLNQQKINCLILPEKAIDENIKDTLISTAKKNDLTVFTYPDILSWSYSGSHSSIGDLHNNLIYNKENTHEKTYSSLDRELLN